MKKIVGIIAALALAGSVFADPNVAPVIASFSGSANLDYVIDLDGDGNDVTMGMQNGTSSEFKIKFISEGTKETSGDGLWGKLKIKAGNVEVANGNKAAEFFVVPTPSIEEAIIYFSEDDFYANVDIKKPGLGISGGKYVIATRSDNGSWANPATSLSLSNNNGFKVNFGLKNTVDFGLTFEDNGVVKADAKKFAFIFDASLKAVENLELYAGAGYSTEEEKFAIAAKTSYKLGLTDTMYLRPSVGFSLKDEAKALGACVLFGWGKENQNSDYFVEFDSLAADKRTIAKKFTDGVSFALNSNLDNEYKFIVGFYDGTLLSGLSEDILGGRKVAADFQGDLKTLSAEWQMNFALNYGHTCDIWKSSADFGLRAVTAKVGTDTKTNTGFVYGFGVSTDNSIIQNTELYAKYKGEQAADLGGANKKGKITIGAKIHF